MVFSKSVSFLIVSLFVFESVSCHVDYYCSKNTFPSNSTSLQFTKEVSTTEYAVLDKFKSLHCCAKGYRSIEWFKDSRPYPWASGVSSFILYSDAANQTVYTQQTVETDSGNYTCVLKNGTHTMVHSVQLTPVDKPPSSPKATVTPKDQWAELGQSVRFYCEAFVGRINLPDVRNDISWKRVYPKGIKPSKQSLHLEEVNREDEQVIGAYFIIDHVGTQDYGQYVCTVANADSVIEIPIWLHHKASESPSRYVSVPWKSLLLVAILIATIIMTAVVVYMKYGRKVQLNWMKSFAKTRENCDKEYDLCILYNSSTAAKTSDYFVPTLQNKYSYKCCSYQLPESIDQMFNSAHQSWTQSHNIVAVLDAKEFFPKDLMFIIAKMHMLSNNSRPTLVCVQDMPKVEPMAKNENGENLQSLLRKTNVLVWKSANDKDFWIKLRLHLPHNNQSKLSQSTINKSSIEFNEFKRDAIENDENQVDIVV